MEDCLFCKIVEGSIPSKKVYEDNNVYAFEDISPMAKEHYLFISKSHSKNINVMKEADILAVMAAIKSFTTKGDLETNGFRVVTNINDDGGQTVFHTHFHVIGGEKLGSFGA